MSSPTVNLTHFTFCESITDFLNFQNTLTPTKGFQEKKIAKKGENLRHKSPIFPCLFSIVKWPYGYEYEHVDEEEFDIFNLNTLLRSVVRCVNYEEEINLSVGKRVGLYANLKLECFSCRHSAVFWSIMKTLDIWKMSFQKDIGIAV